MSARRQSMPVEHNEHNDPYLDLQYLDASQSWNTGSVRRARMFESKKGTYPNTGQRQAIPYYSEWRNLATSKSEPDKAELLQIALEERGRIRLERAETFQRQSQKMRRLQMDPRLRRLESMRNTWREPEPAHTNTPATESDFKSRGGKRVVFPSIGPEHSYMDYESLPPTRELADRARLALESLGIRRPPSNRLGTGSSTSVRFEAASSSGFVTPKSRQLTSYSSFSSMHSQGGSWRSRGGTARNLHDDDLDSPIREERESDVCVSPAIPDNGGGRDISIPLNSQAAQEIGMEGEVGRVALFGATGLDAAAGEGGDIDEKELDELLEWTEQFQLSAIPGFS